MRVPLVDVVQDPIATAAVLPPMEVSEPRGRHARRQSRPLLAPEGIGATTTTTAATRDYNFFDELDARLADLQDSD
jgi:hypothetical protein